jgi:hypothetical protein
VHYDGRHFTPQGATLLASRLWPRIVAAAATERKD